MPAPIVLDTGIVIGALTGKETSHNSQLVDKACRGLFPFVTSADFFDEFYRVVGYPSVDRCIWSAGRAVRTVMDLLGMGTILTPTRCPWPTVTDEKDHWMLDLAWEAKAAYLVSDDPHMTRPTMPFAVQVVSAEIMLEKVQRRRV